MRVYLGVMRCGCIGAALGANLPVKSADLGRVVAAWNESGLLLETREVGPEGVIIAPCLCYSKREPQLPFDSSEGDAEDSDDTVTLEYKDQSVTMTARQFDEAVRSFPN